MIQVNRINTTIHYSHYDCSPGNLCITKPSIKVYNNLHSWYLLLHQIENNHDRRFVFPVWSAIHQQRMEYGIEPQEQY